MTEGSPVPQSSQPESPAPQLTQPETTISVEKPREKVFEEKLLNSISKTHSVPAFLKAYGLDIVIYWLMYMAGQRKVHLVWLVPPTVLLCVKDIWTARRDERAFQEVVRTLRDDGKALVLSDPTQLPPWVQYPDVERCSWVNELLVHFWPFLTGLLAERVTAWCDKHKDKMKGISLRTVSFGTVPPTVSGVKVYDRHMSNSHLVGDAFLYYAGDCAFGIAYKGVPGGIDSFQIRGPCRIDFFIVDKRPFVGGVEFSFLGKPEVDFVLTGLFSLGLAEDVLRKIIESQIAKRLVFPRKFKKVWTKVDEESLLDLKGVIRVNIVEAKELENKDNFLAGLSDPYAIVSYGSRKLFTKVIDNNLSPRWDFWCEFARTGRDAEVISIKVMDQDDPGSDDFIGSYNLKVTDIEKEGKIDFWTKLDKSKGSIHIRACVLEVSTNLEDVRFPPEEFSFLSSFVLTVLVKNAHNLKVPRVHEKPSATVQLTVGNDTQETRKVENNSNPVFGDCFSLFVNNPDFNKLRVNVVDYESGIEIGSFSYSLRKLLDCKDFEIQDQHFPLLDSVSDSSVVLSMKLRAIKNVFF